MRKITRIAALAALTLGLAAAPAVASASVTHPAIPLSCNNPGSWANEFGDWTVANSNTGTQVYAVANEGGNTWCTVNNSSDGTDGYRLDGTNVCAQYKGSNDGPGSVRLETCAVSTTPGQQWAQEGDQEHPAEVTLQSDIQVAAGDIGICLSSDSGSDEPLIMINDPDGCTGNGGQSWSFGTP